MLCDRGFSKFNERDSFDDIGAQRPDFEIGIEFRFIAVHAQIALLKGDFVSIALEKCVEMGAGRLRVEAIFAPEIERLADDFLHFGGVVEFFELLHRVAGSRWSARPWMKKITLAKI